MFKDKASQFVWVANFVTLPLFHVSYERLYLTDSIEIALILLNCFFAILNFTSFVREKSIRGTIFIYCLILISYLVAIFRKDYYVDLVDHIYLYSLSVYLIAPNNDSDYFSSKSIRFLVSIFSAIILFGGIVYAVLHSSREVSIIFKNRNVFSLYIFLLAGVLYLQNVVERRKYLIYLNRFVIFLATIIIIFNQSRVVLIPVLLFLSLLIKKKYYRYLYLVISVFIISFLSLLPKKQASTESRVFIMKTTLPKMEKELVFGNGINSFDREYMGIQARYFTSNTVYSNEALVADNVSYLFCDPLQLIFEQGLFGFSIYLALVLYFILLFSLKNDNTYYLIFFLGVLFVSFFQYPFHVIQIFGLIQLIFLPRIVLLEKTDQGVPLYFNYQTPFVQTLFRTVIVLFVIILASVALFIVLQPIRSKSKTVSSTEKSFYDFFNCRNNMYLTTRIKDKFFEGKFQEVINICEKVENFQKTDYLYAIKGEAFLFQRDTTNAINNFLLASQTVPRRKFNHQKLRDLYFATRAYTASRKQQEMIDFFRLNRSRTVKKNRQI